MQGVGAPIFHCNGDDPEGVAHCCRLAVDWRQVIIRSSGTSKLSPSSVWLESCLHIVLFSVSVRSLLSQLLYSKYSSCEFTLVQLLSSMYRLKRSNIDSYWSFLEVLQFSEVIVSSETVLAYIVVHIPQKFQTDVVVDLVCYRRHGHNEQVRPLPLFCLPLYLIYGTSKPVRLWQGYIITRKFSQTS